MMVMMMLMMMMMVMVMARRWVDLTAAAERRSVFKVERSVEQRERISTLLAGEPRHVKRDESVCGSKVEVFRWREGMQVNPARASLDNPDRSCPLRLRWRREGWKVEDIDGEEEEEQGLGSMGFGEQ